MEGNIVRLFGLLIPLVIGVICIIWPKRIQEYTLKCKTQGLGKFNFSFDWMKTRSYVVTLRIVGLIVTASIVIWILYPTYYIFYKVPHERKLKRQEKIERLEASFQKTPLAWDAAELMAEFYNKHDYEKALYYGKACLDLGVNNARLKVWANYLMAKIYKKTDNYDLARKHLAVAITLDQENMIKNEKWIERDGMQDVLSENERR